MDRLSASYYRAILHLDSENLEVLPESLVKLHQWMFKACQAVGLATGSGVSKQTALNVATLWLSSTVEGLEFAKTIKGMEEVFVPAFEPVLISGLDVTWADVQEDADVMVTVDSASRPLRGKYKGNRGGGWLNVMLATSGETRAFRMNQVQLHTEG